jgi:hypothetical protein
VIAIITGKIKYLGFSWFDVFFDGTSLDWREKNVVFQLFTGLVDDRVGMNLAV